MWTILFVGNKIQGFSGIQEKGFPDYTCRIMTRTFIDPELRFHGIGRGLYRDTNPPMLQICKYHYNWVLNNLDKNNCFTSTENNRKSVIKNNLKKMSQDLNIETKLLNDRYQTYPKDEKNAWQNIGLYIIKDDKFDIPNITQKLWIEKYG